MWNLSKSYSEHGARTPSTTHSIEFHNRGVIYITPAQNSEINKHFILSIVFFFGAFAIAGVGYYGPKYFKDLWTDELLPHSKNSKDLD